jgi:hypothetical protein
MPKILDLGMYDEEYLQLIAQGRDPIQEYFYKRQLLRAGCSPEDANQLVLLLMNQDLSGYEKEIVWEFWELMLG